MCFKVDEDLPGEVAACLRAAGHDACTVTDQQMSGFEDDRIWTVAQTERRCLITADKGFASARRLASSTHAGLVLFRLPRESRRSYIALAELLVERFDLSTTANSIVVVSPNVIRVHRAPHEP